MGLGPFIGNSGWLRLREKKEKQWTVRIFKSQKKDLINHFGKTENNFRKHFKTVNTSKINNK